jgi:COMPASS component SWD3
LLCTNGTLTLWDSRLTQELARWKGLKHLAASVAFDPEGKRVFVQCRDFGAYVAEVDTGRLVELHKERSSGVVGMDVSPDNRIVALAHYNGRILLWAYAPGDMPRCMRPLTEYDELGSVAFSPDGRLAVGLDKGNINLWDIEHRSLVGALKGHRQPVLALGFNLDGDTLVSISPDELRVWRVTHR